MVGVDLSPEMIEQARGKGLYDKLVTADIADFLAAESIDAPGAYHLVIAADVFVYVPDLAAVTAMAAAVLAPDGFFAFTVESHAGEGARIGETLRYAHGADIVRHAIAAAGLTLIQLEEAALRREKGEPVRGLIVVAAK
jgi:predicted TPR repeat methyltransferase